jgi:hypothetical protein
MTLAIPFAATDANVPAQVLHYDLPLETSTGAVLNPTNGLFTCAAQQTGHRGEDYQSNSSRAVAIGIPDAARGLADVQLLDAAGKPMANTRLWLTGENLPPGASVRADGAH